MSTHEEHRKRKEIPVVPGWDARCRTSDFNTNTSILLSAGPHPLLKLDDWSTLKLSVKDETFVFSINDEKIAETGDNFAFVHEGREIRGKVGRLDNFLTGRAGFGIANYTARFDNLIITGKDIPDKGKLTVGSQAKLATMWAEFKQF